METSELVAEPGPELDEAVVGDVLRRAARLGPDEPRAAKGVRIHHRGMVQTAFAFAERPGLPAGGVWVDPMPQFHTAGNDLGSVGALWQHCRERLSPFEVPRRWHPARRAAADRVVQGARAELRRRAADNAAE